MIKMKLTELIELKEKSLESYNFLNKLFSKFNSTERDTATRILETNISDILTQLANCRDCVSMLERIARDCINRVEVTI